MESKKLCYLFVAAGIGITLYLNYLILKPFLSPILLGIIFSIVFYPVYLKLLKFAKGRKAIASLGVCLLVTIIIIIPIIYLTSVFVDEITRAYTKLDEVLESGRYKELFPLWDTPVFQKLYQKVNRYLEAFQTDIKSVLLNSVKGISSYSVDIMTGVIKNLALFIINLFLMLFTMYYLLKDSNILSSELKNLIPLTNQQKERIFIRLKDIVHATIYGTFVAATVQGFLGGLAFWALGLSSPVIWGIVMGLLAVVPVLGAFFIWLPASAILFIQGSYISAVFLILWGSLVISMVDNLIWSLLVSNKAMLHPLVTLFSFLGGLIVFGPIGLFVGPFLMAVFLVLMDIIKESDEMECPT